MQYNSTRSQLVGDLHTDSRLSVDEFHVLFTGLSQRAGTFLPRDATQSYAMASSLSVCLSVRKVEVL